MVETGRLDGRVALITGASSGMGRATALLFARQGAHVALLARSVEGLNAVAAQIRGAVAPCVGRAWACAVDLADGPATRRAVADAIDELGRIDVVVSVAGTNLPERALAVLTPENWERLLATNLSGAFHVTQAVLPQMRARGDGLLIYVSTYAVQRPDTSGVAYQASKHGLSGLAHGTREEERASGIRTTVIFPGLTDTPLLAKRPTPTPPEVVAKALQPEDVAEACLFVATRPPRVRIPELQIVPSAL